MRRDGLRVIIPALSQEMVARGFKVTAVARSRSGIGGKNTEEDVKKDLDGAEVVFGNCSEAADLENSLAGRQFDVVVSCLASRTGTRSPSP